MWKVTLVSVSIFELLDTQTQNGHRAWQFLFDFTIWRFIKPDVFQLHPPLFFCLKTIITIMESLLFTLFCLIIYTKVAPWALSLSLEVWWKKWMRMSKGRELGRQLCSFLVSNIKCQSTHLMFVKGGGHEVAPWKNFSF